MTARSSISQKEQIEFVKLTVNIVSAYVSNNSVPTADLIMLLSIVYITVSSLNHMVVLLNQSYPSGHPRRSASRSTGRANQLYRWQAYKPSSGTLPSMA